MQGTQLHWLYEHGAYAWGWTVAAVTLFGAALAWRRPRARRAKAARSARAELGAPIRALDALPTTGPATLVGRLVDAGAEPGDGDSRREVAWTIDSREAPGGARTDPPQIVRGERAVGLAIGEGVVLLDGPLEVLVGSREAPHADRALVARRFSHIALHAPRAERPLSVRTLRIGDVVRARGIVAREALRDGAGYRDAKSVAKLVPEEGGAIAIACERAPRLFGPARAPMIRGTLLAAVAGFALVALGGEIAYDRGKTADGATTGLEISPTALAAASPFRRNDALHQLAFVHLRVFGAEAIDAPRLARGARALVLTGECGLAVQAWQSRGYMEEALAIARTCKTPMKGDDLFAAGMFADASAEYTRTGAAPSLSVSAAHIAAHRFDEAARSVRAYSAARETGQDSQSRERAEALGCIADALAIKGGDERGRVGLRAAVASRAMCRVLYADVVSGAQRLGLFSDPNAEWVWRDAQAMEFTKGRVLHTAERLLEDGGGPLPSSTYAFSIFPKAATTLEKSYESEHLADIPIGLQHDLLVRGGIPEDAYSYRVMLAGNVALFLAVIGEHEEAESVARTLRDVPAAPGEHAWTWARPTYDEIERTLTVLRARPTLAHAWAAGVSCAGCGLFAAMDAAAARRNAAREAGHSAEEGAQAIRVRRFRDAVFDREIAVPLHMLEAFDVREH